MRLARIQSEEERNNLLTIAKENWKLFKDEFFVDANDDSIFSCQTFKRPFRGNFLVNTAELENQLSKFLCEDVEVAETFEDKQSREVIDIKLTFFQPIGDYNSEFDDVSKSYYLSRTSLTPPEATVACRSFGMVLASPVNQQEYNKLQLLLENYQTSATIAVYRSETNDDVWIDGNGNPIGYEIQWADGEPSNTNDNEHCAFFQEVPSRPMNDVPCNVAYTFVCEQNNNNDDAVSVAPINLNEVSKYMKDSAMSTIDTMHETLLYYPSKPSMKLSWFEAKLICESFGMKIFAPENKFQADVASDFIEHSDDYYSFHVGFTMMGTVGSWYSANDGKVMNRELNKGFTTSNDFRRECFVIMHEFDSKRFVYTPADCSERHNFICQKSIPLDIHEGQSYQLVSSNDDDDDDGN